MEKDLSCIGKGSYPALEKDPILHWKRILSCIGKGSYPALEIVPILLCSDIGNYSSSFILTVK
jgi:hypothetical protein